MIRRSTNQDSTPENHDRWLVSYADFITLLFAFFVLMFASSQTDAVKMRAISQSLKDAIQGHPSEVVRSNADQLTESSEALIKGLSEEIASGKISVTMEARGLVISLQDSAFFPSGSDSLLPAAVPSMNTIARIIGRLPNPVRLEGHTDSKPISNTRFRSNWELSAARAIAVLESFTADHGIPPSRLAVVAYADTMPKAANDSEQGRSANRRVDVTILNEQSTKHEPRNAP